MPFTLKRDSISAFKGYVSPSTHPWKGRPEQQATSASLAIHAETKKPMENS